MPSADCSSYPSNCGELQPNQDIAGIGVYITFIASASLTLVGSVLKFICRARMQTELGERHPAFIGHLRRLRPSMTRRQGRRWAIGGPSTRILSLRTAQTLDAMLRPLILGLADQQLVTGLAILIAAFKDWQTITGYHYNIVVYLAWFSGFTHAVALFSLGDMLKKSRVLLGVRVVAFLALFVLFVVAQSRARTFGNDAYGPTSMERDLQNGKGNAAACPAQCSASARSYNGAALEIRICIIGIAVFGIFLTWGDGKWFALAGGFRHGRYMDVIMNTAFVLWLVVVAVLAFGLAFGMAAAMSLRSLSQYPGLRVAANFDDQNSWSFGQLVAVILLILPFLAAFQELIDIRASLPNEKDLSSKEGELERTSSSALAS